MCIAARVCAPQPQFFYIINELILKNDNNAVLITMVLSWVNICQPILLVLTLSLFFKNKKLGKMWGKLAYTKALHQYYSFSIKLTSQIAP